MLPSVSISKRDGQTGVVRPSANGVLAIIAPSSAGTTDAPASFARSSDATSSFGIGALTEYASYFMSNTGKPVVLIRANATTAGAYGSVTFTGTGTSVITSDGTTLPFDEYDVVFTVVAGGTVGSAGITYKYSLDGGVTTSGVLALGTATTVTLNVPVLGVSSGCKFHFAAGTLVAGDQFTCSTARPQMNSSDLSAALEALRTTRLPWEGVLVDGDCTSSSVSTIDTWLANLESTGVFKMAWTNTRHKNKPAPSAETEAAFETAMGVLLASTSTIRVDVGTDAGDLVSPLTGLTQARPVSLAAATRALAFSVGVDPAYVANGAIPGFQIADTSGNPKWHDEALFPGLDDLRLTTFRSMNDRQGVYLTNANLLSPNGSDYVYDQHARTMNAACALAYSLLATELSKGVGKQKPDPVTGKIYILEADAAAIEAVINSALATALKGQVAGAKFVLSRTDDLSSNAGATVHGEVQVESLAYVKNYAVTATFVRSISVAAAA